MNKPCSFGRTVALPFDLRRRRGQVKLHRSATDARTADEAGDEPPP